ncbi:MAG: carboxynorspermidine decarboxylase [Candidatus Ratteibacteria bacterium]|jgi:carboxynorspermidine decarboxylase
MKLPLKNIPTPCYVVDEGLLEKNLKVLKSVQDKSGAEIILALKGFACWHTFSLIRKYLAGTAASSLDEARLGFEEFGREVHLCGPAYRESEFKELLSYCSHITFNSFSQWQKFRPLIKKYGKKVNCGIRVNPQHSEVKVPIYDPCGRYSRLGVTAKEFHPEELDGISGLHFHTLCELNADALERTLAEVEAKFGKYLKGMEWVNFGGGHHITRSDYDVAKLCRLVKSFRKRYGCRVYLEPGEAIALNTGVLVAQVLDIVRNEMEIAVLDTSAAAHMPDVLEMPYRPKIVNAGNPGEYPYTYRLAGLTCLAGDVIGDYSFRKPLRIGAKLIFLDMAHYTMVKNNTFNGVRLPSIACYRPKTRLRLAIAGFGGQGPLKNRDGGKVRIVRTFGYQDYRNRLS